ncbi:MAG: polyprenyl synthetase family protein [Candidatus Omnitrophota bacterium]|nr:polyprenyl synthetase family protein [Candidatus Omnitrophota bacterium]
MSQTIALEDIYAPIEPQLQSVPAAILETVSGSNELAEDVIRYFFSAKGKLLRPAMTFLGAAVKDPGVACRDRLVRLGAAFEIFHGATLIHDDIIDSAYVRRNLPTVHIKWNPQIAVLVGDFLHDRAIGTIFEYGTPAITKLFLKTAGTVCDGEIHELKEKENLALSEDDYFDIIDKKTASLMACALASGALLAGADDEEVEALKQFGHCFGIAFQIVDDCLDFTGSEHEFGKTLGADVAAGVLTLPLIRLLAAVEAEKKAEVCNVLRSEMTPEKLQMLLGWIREYDTLTYSFEKAREFSDRARNQLAIFDDTPAKGSLDRLLNYVLERNR